MNCKNGKSIAKENFKDKTCKIKFRDTYTYTITEGKEVLVRVYFQIERVSETEGHVREAIIYTGTQVK